MSMTFGLQAYVKASQANPVARSAFSDASIHATRLMYVGLTEVAHHAMWSTLCLIGENCV